ncbi:uncharacterized protein LOC118180393, partial [Stegodyphus dumicola]|uniref:uncharacterized protein LOC118180393 n=1 Tax=Stegodyphus dumicola TaxID=202533 RepID=UPI0015A9A851
VLHFIHADILLSDNETDLFYIMSCRTERGIQLTLDEYRRDTCARCYHYLPDFAFRDDSVRLRYNEGTGFLMDPIKNTSYDADPENISHPAYETFQSDLFARKWIACCRAALELCCCSRMISDPMLNVT